jgi:hypothetical protein
MRLLTISKLLALGGTAAWAVSRLARTSKPDRRSDGLTASDFAPDPRDPVQSFDEVTDLYVTDLDVDAMDVSDAQASQDLATMEIDLEDGSLESASTYESIEIGVDETGERYGVRTPPTADRALLDNDAATDDGQNWVEALETSAVYGAEPETEIEIVDDMDTASHSTDLRDRPVADRGSGGPAGV